jgi:hypothetical protein
MLHEQKKLVMNGETPRRAFRRPCSVRSSIQQVSHATDVKEWMSRVPALAHKNNYSHDNRHAGRFQPSHRLEAILHR